MSPPPKKKQVNVLVNWTFVLGNLFLVLTGWQVQLTISCKIQHENGKHLKSDPQNWICIFMKWKMTFWTRKGKQLPLMRLQWHWIFCGLSGRMVECGLHIPPLPAYTQQGPVLRVDWDYPVCNFNVKLLCLGPLALASVSPNCIMHWCVVQWIQLSLALSSSLSLPSLSDTLLGWNRSTVSQSCYVNATLWPMGQLVLARLYFFCRYLLTTLGFQEADTILCFVLLHLRSLYFIQNPSLTPLS